MIKIIHIITGLNTGGSETALLRLLGNIDPNRFTCEVISLTDIGPIGQQIQKLNIPVRAIGMRSLTPNPLLVLRLSKLLRIGAPDILHTWMYHANLIGSMASKLAGRPKTLWSIRQTNLDLESIKLRTFIVAHLGAWLSGAFPQTIICNSEAGRQTHTAIGYDESKFTIIPNGFNLDVFRPNVEARASVRKELGLSADTVLIGQVARFDPQKDHKTFARAAGLLLRKHPCIKFLLCGPGIDSENERLADWLNEAKALEHCYLMGMRNDIARLTAAVDIAVSSSMGEGFANAIGEAMACEVPCVVTDVGDSALIVGDTGRVTAPRDPASLAIALSELINAGPSRRSELGRIARARVREHYDINRATRLQEDVYLTVLNKQGTQAG